MVPDPEPDPIDYSGNYIGLTTNIILGELMDTVTWMSYVGYDTVVIESDILDISLVSGTNDSFLLDGVIFKNGEVQAQGWLVNDTLYFEYDQSSTNSNHYTRGKMWYDESTILHAEYEWNNFDTWSYGALPDWGEVTGEYSLQ